MGYDPITLIRAALLAGLACLVILWFVHPALINLYFGAYSDMVSFACDPFNLVLSLCEGRQDYYCDSVRCALVNQAMVGLIISDLILLALTLLAAKPGKKR